MGRQQQRFGASKIVASAGIRMAHRLLACGLLAYGSLVSLPASAEKAPEIVPSWGLGQVITEGATLQGVRVPSGSTLMDDSLLKTEERPATIHFSGGQVLRLASHSSAYFAETDSGVRMDVRSGQATLRGEEPEARTFSQDMIAFLQQDGRVEYQIASLDAAVQDNPPPVGTGVEVGAPAISSAERNCLPNVPFPLLDAVIQPGPDVRVAKVYFRAAQHPNFYAVEMTGVLDDFEAILPAPGSGTDQVVYYIEAISTSLESSRTEEYTADVVGEAQCQDQGGAGRFEGKNPGIALIPTVPGSPLVPPGFQPLGLLGVAGGGLGVGTLTGIIAGGLAGGILLVDELDDDDEPPASPVTP